MAAYSALLRGASEVYVVDRVPERLAKAKEIGCTPIDFSKGDAAEQIKALRNGYVLDKYNIFQSFVHELPVGGKLIAEWTVLLQIVRRNDVAHESFALLSGRIPSNDVGWKDRATERRA